MVKGCGALKDSPTDVPVPGWRWIRTDTKEIWRGDSCDANWREGGCGYLHRDKSKHYGDWMLLCPACQRLNGAKW